MFSFPWWLSLLIGFLSLSEEILWVRVGGFAYETKPPAFSFILACYLVGIALGAIVGKSLCRRVRDLYGAAAMIVALAGAWDVFIPWFIGHPLPHSVAMTAAAIIVTAAIKSTLFPIVHHLGSEAEGPRVGRSMSRIYFGNILGSTLGPLLTGFVALDHLSVDECFFAAAAVSLLASIGCCLKSSRRELVFVTLLIAIPTGVVESRTYQPLAGSMANLVQGGSRYMLSYVADRHGVIHTSLSPFGEAVFGGNVYDGIITVNVDTNPNRLDRVYLLPIVQPNLKHLFFVGLSTGAWVRAAQGFPGVDSIDVVEINPAYLQLIRQRPQVSPLLKDPRIHINIDDGRRWLRRHPQARFDAIVANTTYYWRAYSGNLLSFEYFELIKQHLNPGGVFISNTTGSFDVLATAAATFKYAYRYANFVYCSDHPLTADPGRLLATRRPDNKFFSFDSAYQGSVSSVLSGAHLEPAANFVERHHVAAQVITDDNLVTEYRHGRRFGFDVLQKLLPPPQPEFLFEEP